MITYTLVLYGTSQCTKQSCMIIKLKNRTRYIIKLMFFSLINGHDEDLQILTDIPP